MLSLVDLAEVTRRKLPKAARSQGIWYFLNLLLVFTFSPLLIHFENRVAYRGQFSVKFTDEVSYFSIDNPESHGSTEG